MLRQSLQISLKFVELAITLRALQNSCHGAPRCRGKPLTRVIYENQAMNEIV